MKKTINKIYDIVLKYKGCSLNDEECKLFQELQNDLEKKTGNDIFVAWLKSVLEIKEINGKYEIVIKSEFLDKDGVLNTIKEWLENGK